VDDLRTDGVESLLQDVRHRTHCAKKKKPPHLSGLRSSSGKPTRGRIGSDFGWRGARV